MFKEYEEGLSRLKAIWTYEGVTRPNPLDPKTPRDHYFKCGAVVYDTENGNPDRIQRVTPCKALAPYEEGDTEDDAWLKLAEVLGNDCLDTARLARERKARLLGS